MMNRESRFEIRYVLTTANGVREERVFVARSEEKRNEALATCKRAGYEVLSCKKLYPFNTERNQHNFFLIANICANRMYEIETDVRAKWTPEIDAEYARLEALKETADRLCGAELPIAWLTWDDLKAARELSEAAVEHRVSKVLEAGRPDLVQYC